MEGLVCCGVLSRSFQLFPGYQISWMIPQFQDNLGQQLGEPAGRGVAKVLRPTLWFLERASIYCLCVWCRMLAV